MNTPTNQFFAPGDEFARIERMFGAGHFAADGRGLGDDGFVWEPGSGAPWVVSSDASAEGVHYRLDWASPARALRKALLANLSDINAMGGATRLAFFNLGARADWTAEVFDTLGAVLREMEQRHGFRVAGGDTTVLPGPGFFSFTVMGRVRGSPLLRGNARSGQRLYATGSLGASSAGLALLRAGSSAGEAREEALVRAHLDPAPPLELGPLLASLCRAERPVAAIDISDGLSSELWHLARQSGCALRVDAEALPLHPALSALPPAEARAHALNGGEEYQLLFSGDFTAGELDAMRALCPVTEIGVVEAGEGVVLRENGATRPLEARGYSHGN